MSRLVVFTFDGPEKATQARASLKSLERSGSLSLDDALVMERPAAGEVRQRREPSRAVFVGALVGGLMGVALFFMFPVIGIVFGVVVGGLIGRLASGRRIDREFVHDARAALRPGNSALLLLLGEADMQALGTALRCFDARLFETALTPELESTLRQALVCPDTQVSLGQETAAAV